MRLLLALVAGAGLVQAPRPEILVSAAASLGSVLRQVAEAWERSHPERIVLNAAGSNTLARQVLAGARVDLFISADEAQMDRLAGRLAAGTRVNLLSNQLAIAVPDDRPGPWSSARDLLRRDVRRVAMGDPVAVPAGVYAKAYLERLGIWDAVASKVIPSGSVRMALAAVENGSADAAIVYRTDLATARRARVALVVPAADGPPIVYPAAVVRGGPNEAAARRFLAFLRGAEATAIFERAGFLRP